jgi:hypothetical protein
MFGGMVISLRGLATQAGFEKFNQAINRQSELGRDSSLPGAL